MSDQTQGTEHGAQNAEQPAKAKKVVTKKRTGKAKAIVSHAKAYIHATYNNTIVTLTDQNGNTLAWTSAGSSGFSGPKKATPYAASQVVRKLMEKVADRDVKDVSIFITGVGQGREGAIRAFHAQGLNVLGIQDITPIPHNGCRAPRPRRV